jgi:PPOX class probable F420-dependent enzyme
MDILGHRRPFLGLAAGGRPEDGDLMAMDPGPDPPASGYFASLAGTSYMQLTTYRRDGTAVATPVHFVVVGDTAFFRTWDATGKAKRIRHTPGVEVAPSTFRGRPLGPPLRADAELLEGVASDHAARLLSEKHPFLHRRLIPWYHRLRGWTTQQYRLTRPSRAI